MKRAIVLLLLVGGVFECGAAETDPAWIGKIRRDHPRMFFNRETWPELERRARTTARAAYEALLRRCDAYPTNPVCSGTGLPAPRPGLTEDAVHTGIPPIKEWGTEAAACALAWRFTREAKYLEKAKAMLRANVAGYDAAFRNRRAVSWYSTTRINSLCAYDWIFEALTDSERRAVIVPLVRHVEDVQPRPGRSSIRRRNTGGVTAGCYGVRNLMWYAGLAALGDGFCDDLARRLLVEGHAYHAETLAFRSTSAGDDGGLATATPGYALGVYPVGHFNVFHTWLSATGENLADAYAPMALYPNWVWWMWIPDAADPARPLFHGAGDAYHTTNRLPVESLYEHLTQYIHFFRRRNPEMARLAAALRARAPNRTLGASWPAYPFLFDDAGADPALTRDALENAPLKARHFEQLGQIFMRSGWTPGDTYAQLIGGTRLPMHKHHDEGSFTIYKHDFLALDAGSRANQTDWNLKYYYAQSVAHNVVLVQKPGETPLPAAWGPRADVPEGRLNDGGMYGTTGTVRAFETNPLYSYAALDTGALYGAKCTENTRQFVHVQPDFFVVYDRVAAADPGYRKRWLLHGQNEPARAGRVTAFSSRGGRLFCETLLPADAALDVVGGPGKEFWSNGRNWELYPPWRKGQEAHCAKDGRGPYWGGWRLEVTPGAPRTEDRFLHVLTAADTNAVAGVAATRVETAAQDGVTLALGAREVTFLFNRAGAVGGTVRVVARDRDGRVASDETRPLATNVAAQAGLAWKPAPKDTPPRKVILGTVCHRFAGSPEERAALANRLVDEIGARARKDCAGRAPDLVLLPEHCLNVNAAARKRALPMAFVTDALGPAARRNGCYIAAGVIVTEVVAGRDVPRNACVLLDRTGAVAGVYRKHHTACDWDDPAATDSERGIAPGGTFPVFRTDFGTVGFLVCWDMSYADGWAALKRAGAEIVGVTSMSPQAFRPALFAHLHDYWVFTATPRSQAAVIAPGGFVKERVGDASVLVTEIDLSYALLHWSPTLKGGEKFEKTFGKGSFGGIYRAEEDNGIFWSDRPDRTVGQMIEEMNIRDRDHEAARSARVADRNRVPAESGVFK